MDERAIGGAKMKICFLTHNLGQDNGAGVFSRRLIAGICAALGVEAVALTSAPSGESYERSLLAPNKLRLTARIFQIRAVLRDCDVIHALDAFPYGLIAAIASVGLGKPLIITTIGSGSILPFYQRRFAFGMRWTYRRADRIVAISAYTRDEILKKMPDLNIAVINPGVDADEFPPRSSSSQDSAGDLVKKYQPYVLSVGQLRWRKGYHFSIRAFAKVAALFPELHYVIVGKRYQDDYYLRLQNLVKELDLVGKVHIVEHADTRAALADWYRGAELFCLFSQNIKHDVEGFGLVFLEAAAAGLAAVGSKNCGVDDAVRDGVNGILVPSRDPNDFADAIITILKDPSKKKEMAAASRVFARQMSWDRHATQYATLYREMVAK